MHFTNKGIIHIQFIGAKFYFIWVSFLIAFIYNTTLLTRNIAYVLWLILYTLFIISLNFYKTDEKNIMKIIKYYVLSFKVLGFFGIAQFLLAIIGIKFFVTDWWIINVFPRINGFSYEPSYFSTYLMIGWTINFYLLKTGNKNIKKELGINSSLWIITICQLLTSSRMGIFLMIFLFVWPSFYKLLISLLNNKLNIKSIISLVLITGSIGLIVVFQWNKISFLFNGLGIGGTASHSSSIRLREFGDTIEIFLESPVLGYSLGGVASAIAELRGTIITSQLEAKNFEGMNIFAEVLAASGFFGFIFFCLFIYCIYDSKKHINKLTSFLNPDFVVIYNALTYALTIEFILLCMNQNILRAYLWIHIGIINFLYFSLLYMGKSSRDKQIA